MSVRKIGGHNGYNDLKKKFTTVYCTTAVTKGDVVILDTAADVVESQSGLTTEPYGDYAVKKATATANDPLAVGVADETLDAAGLLRVQVAGFCDTVTCEAAGGINRGDPVGTDNTAAGRVQAFSGNLSATSMPFARCVNAFTANTADGAICIYDQGYFYAE